jgi:O-antigen/teichoic acid export membrane protein
MLGGATLVAARSEGLHLLRAKLATIASVRRPLTKFLLGTNIAGTLRTISTKLDVILIASLLNPAMVAIYRIAGKIASGLMILSDPLLVAIYPELSQLQVERKTDQLHKLLRTLTLALGAFGAVAIIAFALFGTWFITLLAGHHYESAYPVTLVMIAGTICATVFFWARPLLLVRGHAHSLVPIAIASLAVQFGSLYLLAPRFHVLGAGISFALSYIVQVILVLLLIVRTGRQERIARVANDLV